MEGTSLCIHQNLGFHCFVGLILVTEEDVSPLGLTDHETAVSELMCPCHLFKK